MRRMRMTTAAIILTALAAATAGCGRSATASAPPHGAPVRHGFGGRRLARRGLARRGLARRRLAGRYLRASPAQVLGHAGGELLPRQDLQDGLRAEPGLCGCGGP